jgi:complement component 1 Q subcomponent-binding protein, mitochondrial
LGDEEELDNINQGSGKDFKVAPEDSVGEAENEGLDEEEQDQSFATRLSIIVEKPGKGALAVEAVAQSGAVLIENAYFYTDPSLAHAKTADKIHARSDLYVGPPFSNLDEDLQVLLERYLEERGVNTALALFVPDYIDVKEQKEYLSWLTNLKTFVEA